MWRLVPALVEQMGHAYPELVRATPLITETLRQEEERFRTTLGRGMGLLEEATSGLESGGVLSGETAFRLYDTYGFPLDLTQDAVRARGITVDLEGFGRRHGPAEGHGARGLVGFAATGRRRRSGFNAPRLAVGPTDFVGYDQAEVMGEVIAPGARGYRGR